MAKLTIDEKTNKLTIDEMTDKIREIADCQDIDVFLESYIRVVADVLVASLNRKAAILACFTLNEHLGEMVTTYLLDLTARQAFCGIDSEHASESLKNISDSFGYEEKKLESQVECLNNVADSV